MSESPKATSAAEVRAHRAHPRLVALPSGITVEVQRLALLELAAAGRIPDDMTTDVLVGLSEALGEAGEQSPAEAKRRMNRRLEVIDAVCIAMLVEPRMSADGAGDSIAPRDLEFGDRTYLYALALGTEEGPELAPFPFGQGADLAAGADGAGVGSAAVEPAGAR